MMAEVEVEIVCTECDNYVDEGDVVCHSCYDAACEESFDRGQNKEPEFTSCRRCGNKRYVNSKGYCSPACQDGSIKLSEYAPELLCCFQG